MLAALALAVAPALGYVDRGILKLDNTTFDRIVDGSRPVFVRFDKEYAYGEEVRPTRRSLEQHALLQAACIHEGWYSAQLTRSLCTRSMTRGKTLPRPSASPPPRC